MSDPLSHRYGEPNVDYIGTWLHRQDDGPFWALNLMKYRERAIGRDDRSGIEMSNRDDFKEKHEHSDAGMETTIVVASMPREGDPPPADTVVPPHVGSDHATGRNR